MLASAQIYKETQNGCEEQEPQEILLTLGGIPGKVKWGYGGWEVHAKWASHTGYRSTMKQGDAHALAVDLYESQVNLPYLVGDEHKECGWKKISLNTDGYVQIRLPDWASDSLKDSLSRLGMSEICEHNRYWFFPDKVTLEQAREVLAPVLRPKTRFVDEEQLAAEIDRAYQGSSLWADETQISLF